MKIEKNLLQMEQDVENIADALLQDVDSTTLKQFSNFYHKMLHDNCGEDTSFKDYVTTGFMKDAFEEKIDIKAKEIQVDPPSELRRSKRLELKRQVCRHKLSEGNAPHCTDEHSVPISNMNLSVWSKNFNRNQKQKNDATDGIRKKNLRLIKNALSSDEMGEESQKRHGRHLKLSEITVNELCNGRTNFAMNLRSKHGILSLKKEDTHLNVAERNFERAKKQRIIQKINWDCTYCSYFTSSKRAYNVHLTTHDESRTFLCPVCKNFAGYNNSSLSQHMKTHNKESFKCSFCVYRSNYRYRISRHERIHTGEKPYSCSYCSFSCNQDGTLKIHLRRHTGVKPYVCGICNKGFISCSALLSHFKGPHRSLLERV